MRVPDQKSPTRLACISSSGGVLPDVLAVVDNWPSANEQVWVAPRAVDTEDALRGRNVVWADEPAGSPLSMGRAVGQARALLVDRQIDWVISAGTAIALPFFLAARTCAARSLWVETLNIHGGQGRVAEVCSRLAERTLVQSADRLPAHRRALLIGELQ